MDGKSALKAKQELLLQRRQHKVLMAWLSPAAAQVLEQADMLIGDAREEVHVQWPPFAASDKSRLSGRLTEKYFYSWSSAVGQLRDVQKGFIPTLVWLGGDYPSYRLPPLQEDAEFLLDELISYAGSHDRFFLVASASSSQVVYVSYFVGWLEEPEKHEQPEITYEVVFYRDENA